MAEINWSLGLTPDFSSGIKYQEAGQANRQRQLEQQQEQAKQAALSAYAQNPQAGLAGVIATDPRTGIALQDQQLQAAGAQRKAAQDEETRSYQARMSLAKALIHAPKGADRAELATSLGAFIPGVKQEDLQALIPHLDDNNFLNSLAGEYAKKLNFMNLGEGYGVAVDEQTGQKVAEYQAPRRVTLGEGQSLVEIPGNVGGGQPPPATDIRGTIENLIPGARITSGQRTPQHNAEVGGAKNSYHLSGNALDIVPPAGMSMAQLEGAIRNSGLPTAELLNEGDHVHVAWKGAGQPQAQGGARVIAQGAPKAQKQTRPATAEEKAAYGIPADVPAQIKSDGTIDVVNGTGATLKPIPAKIQEGLVGNRGTIRQIDEAIAAIQANPNAMGLKNFLPEGITQRTDLGGVPTRANVANIGSLLIHDRSGAAVTASETPRLKPFIPSATDSPQAAIAKLRQLRRQAENANSEIEVAYGPDSGYRQSSDGSRPAPAQPKRGPGVSFQPNEQQQRAFSSVPGTGPRGAATNPVILNPQNPNGSFANLKSGQYFIGPDGQTRKKP